MNKQLKSIITSLEIFRKKKKITLKDKDALLALSAKLKEIAGGFSPERFCEACGEWDDQNTVTIRNEGQSARFCRKCLLKFARGLIKLPKPKQTKKKTNKPDKVKSLLPEEIKIIPGSILKKRELKKIITVETAKTAASPRLDAPPAEEIKHLSETVKLPEKIVRNIWKAKQSIIFPMDFNGTIDYVASEGMHKIPREKIEKVLAYWIKSK